MEEKFCNINTNHEGYGNDKAARNISIIKSKSHLKEEKNKEK